ncbi:MAG TPA: hypothetical protein PK306_13080 [Aquabacterium sp.]|nr:hypothetical protein [Aquabacterium sp.]HQC96634.1 hypothetical protein [Aquabacterium sp.]
MTHHRIDGAAARALATLAATVLAAAAPAGTAAAGPLADPTRPPAALSAPGGLAAAALPHQANRDTARAIAAAQRAAEPPAPPPPPAVVQAVQLPRPGADSASAAALVDGRLVKPGDLLDGHAVLAIDAQGLLVKGPRGPERLWLLGGAPKQAAGSITQSQTAHYQPATRPGTPSAPPALAGSADAGEALAGPGTSTPLNPSPVSGTGPAAIPAPALPANTSAVPTPLSLARRTAP